MPITWSKSLLLLLLTLVAGGLGFLRNQQVVPSVDTQPVAELAKGWAETTSCAECHFEKAEQFFQTGHAQTLLPVDSPESMELLRKLSKVISEKDSSLRLTFSDSEVEVVSEPDQALASRLKLDWCFGSGTHAHTWVGTLLDSHGERDLVEFRWSWYHGPDDFYLSPGQSKQPPPGYFEALGLLFDAPKAKRCFSCHSTTVPHSEGQMNLSRIHPGVTCQRCHGPRQAHVESDGEIQRNFWSTATQMEAVRACGECHRIAEDQKPQAISPDNHEIVRFQPVGLIQSPCFRSSPEMTCVTCHDPHRPMSAQDSAGIWQCVQCHDGTSELHAVCAAGHLDNCLDCHMPKVQSIENLKFTDHWIRVRKASPQTDP